MRREPIQIIKDKLYWVSDTSPPRNIPKAFYFNIDKDLQYEPFYMDFGPLNLGKTWKYVSELQKLVTLKQYQNNHIYHYTSTDNSKCANSAYLMGAFQIIVLGYTAQKAFQPFSTLNFVPFRDASYGECSYSCTLLHCLRGLEYALKLGWFKYKQFNLAEYQHYQKVDNGDLNWIIPDKFVAFSSPSDKKIDKYGNRVYIPQDYVPIFKKIGVTMVIRLNNKTYDANDFVKEGIKHHDLYFTDGTAPSQEIVQRFLNIVENENGAVAVHCKAGLGRTGSLIACYAMKHYNFPAADFIGWIRIARPGSILGPQQNFLISIEKTMREQSKYSPIWKKLKDHIEEKDTLDKFNNVNLNDMTQREKEIMLNGEVGQGQYLMAAKNKGQKNNYQGKK